MAKPSTQPTTSLEERKAQSKQAQREDTGDTLPKPLSGSKKVKNQNHSGQNHGEGS